MKIKICIYLMVCCFGFMQLSAQENERRFKVSGQIIDARTNKAIKKIPITVLPFNKVVEANGSGKFLFNMPVGIYSFIIDYYPFDKQEVKRWNAQSAGPARAAPAPAWALWPKPAAATP